MLEAYPDHDPDRASAEIRRLVVSLLQSGECSIEAVAQHLGVDRRTIHRRLAGEGETFTHIVASVRRELATHLLADPGRNLAEVSLLLGFSSLSGFSRWHRQQFGKTASARRTGGRAGREPQLKRNKRR
jgi:AraC-like DNA-binding protein